MTSPQERRRSQRVERHLMVRYRTIQVPDAVWLMSPLLDLSSGGAKFISEYALQAGEIIECHLLLPTSAPQPIALQAKVAWVKPLPSRLVELGVTFDPGDAAVQQAIDAAVVFFLKQVAGG